MSKISEAEVTPPELYFNRRAFMKGGVIAAGAVATGWLYRKLNGVDLVETKTAELPGLTHPAEPGYVVNETKTSYGSITNYNNFYEFTTNKDKVASVAAGFSTVGWKVEVGGLCHKPRVFDLDDLRRVSPPEERIYRMRCVEAWSMVIPWVGFSLAELIGRLAPLSSAKYVAFTTLFDPEQLPNQNSRVLRWPYVEGLRLDEATHPLAFMALGLYGAPLPGQNGAPLRLVVPWKYGFKGIKSIVELSFTEHEPPSTWNRAAPDEYGFYANVNPKVDHPRWSQASERRIGELTRRPTLPFNGYAAEVAHLYRDMDLSRTF
jgi:sulfoxide reductase catalytic subunit YedY